MRGFIIVGLAFSLAGPSFAADAGEGRNVIRFGGAYVVPTGDLSEEDSFQSDVGNGMTLVVDATVSIEPQSAVAPFLAYERRFTERLGLEVGTWVAEHDVDGRIQGTVSLLDSGSGGVIASESIDTTENVGEVRVVPVSAGLNFHLIPKSRMDLYVGPAITYVLYDDFEVEGESLSINDDFTWGAVLGLDIPLGEKGWMLTGAARYIDTEAEPEQMEAGDVALDVQPWAVQVSAGYRF